jgi:hypothetical protein
VDFNDAVFSPLAIPFISVQLLVSVTRVYLQESWLGINEDGTEGYSLVEMNSEDVAFCKALAAAGHPIHIDTKVRVGHQKLLII